MEVWHALEYAGIAAASHSFPVSQSYCMFTFFEKSWACWISALKYVSILLIVNIHTWSLFANYTFFHLIFTLNKDDLFHQVHYRYLFSKAVKDLAPLNKARVVHGWQAHGRLFLQSQSLSTEWQICRNSTFPRPIHIDKNKENTTMIVNTMQKAKSLTNKSMPQTSGRGTWLSSLFKTSFSCYLNKTIHQTELLEWITQ